MIPRARCVAAILCLLLAGTAAATSPPRDELSRPPVTGRVGVVTSLHPLSSMAGMRLLLAGGNAFDAAVAAAIATTVVDPKNSSIGGQGFATVYVAKERAVRALNFYGVAPRAATIERLADKPYKMGYLSTPVPSNLKGYQALHSKYGQRPWAEVVQPAIELADQGFAVTEEFIGILGVHAKELQTYPSTRRTYFPEGRLPRVGEVFRQPDLARTLKRIAAESADVFYSGDIARNIAKFYAENGGILAYEDLASIKADESKFMDRSRGVGFVVDEHVSPIGDVRRDHLLHYQPGSDSLARDRAAPGELAKGELAKGESAKGESAKGASLFKRRPGMSHEAFKQYYETRHVLIGYKYITYDATLYSRKFLRPLRLKSDPFAEGARAPVDTPYDVFMELSFERNEDRQRVVAALTPHDIEQIRIDEEKFMDRSDRVAFIVEGPIGNAPA